MASEHCPLYGEMPDKYPGFFKVTECELKKMPLPVS